MVYSAGSAVRPDVGLGTWAFLPARLPDGSTVIVNAGFVKNTMQDRSQQDRAVSPLVTGQPVAMTGYLRFPEKAELLTASPTLAKRLWFGRDRRRDGAGSRLEKCRALLHRSRDAGTCERRSEAWSARRASEG